MLKKLMLASALVTTSAFAQQNTDISGANFQSGKADATLATLGRQAAASGNKLVITAPAEWHAKIAAKVHAGGAANLVLKEGFYENLLVRVEDKSAKPAVAETEKTTKADVDKSRAEAEKAKADAEKSRAEAEKAKAEAEIAKSQAETEKAKAEAETAKAQAAAETARAASMAKSAAAAPAPISAPPASHAPAADVDAIHARLERSLINGHSASGNLPVASLQTGDTLYVDGPVRAVTRRDGGSVVLYWLDGDLDLRRSELKVLAPNRYQLVSSVRGEGTLRRDAAQAAQMLEAIEPAADAPARMTLEKNLNDGHLISETLSPVKLRVGDIIYTSGNTAAVVHREARELTRFWLVGSIDLTQAGIQADGANKYKVLSDTVR